jgi:S1-C subfamily serine protease
MDQGPGGRRLMWIAVGLAAVALATAVVAAVVVVGRGEDKPIERATAAPVAKAPIDRRVAAGDVLPLDRPGELVPKREGVRIGDADLAKKLGLEPDDVIVSISGRPVTRPFDLHEVVFNTSMMNVTTLYVELARDHTLVRWLLDGDLRTARYSSSSSSSSSLYSSGGSPVAPPLPSDPLIDTIVEVDLTHYTIPKASLDAMFASMAKYASQARIVPSVRNGSPDGIKLYAIRPSSIFAHLGLMNGDTIVAINGDDITTADKALRAYTKLRSATQARIDLVRRGKPVTLTITIK